MRKQRLIFINIHWNHLLMNTSMFYLFNIKAPQKYSILFQKLLEKPDIEICNFVTSKGTIVPYRLYCPFRRFLACIESKCILKKNGYSNKIKNIHKLSDIRSDDIVFAFIHPRGGADQLQFMKCEKYLHLNQYSSHSISELNQAIPYATNYILEANTAKEGNYLMTASMCNGFTFHILPYIVASRFINIVSFEKRKKVAIAMGTIAKFEEENDYTIFYKTMFLHKMREEIYENKDYLAGVVDVSVSPYIENRTSGKLNKHHGVLYSLYNLIKNKPGAQKSYFSFNIVDKYNEYQMAVVPEEICGIPAIGAFESMACGCALIAIDDSMYKDLGLVPGIHYVAYDNTVEDLRNKVLYYQKHEDELKKIADAGCSFVRSRFTSEKITDIFLNKILSYKHI